MPYKISSLALSPRSKGATTSEAFISSPAHEKEKLGGNLFVLMEIESKKADDVKLVNFLIEDLNHNYYQNEKMFLREKLDSIKIEDIFESALAKTNKNLGEFLRLEKIRFNPGSMNSIVGVIYDDNILFSSLGRVKGFLIYKKVNKKENDGAQKLEDEYAISDIIESTQREEEKKQINLAKLFSSVVSGIIPAEGYFVFTNEALPEYLSTKQLASIVTSLPPASAAAQIKNTVSQIHTYASFLGIIIKNTTGLGIEEEEELPLSTEESIENFNDTEDSTEKLLSASGIIDFKKWWWKIKELFAQSKITSHTNKKITDIKDKILSKKRSGAFSRDKIASASKGVLAYLANLFSFITKKTKNIARENMNPAKRKENLKKIVAFPAASLKWLKGLSMVNKILLGVVIISIILLFGSISSTETKKEAQVQVQTQTTLLQTIEQKQNMIDSFLLYKNNDGAKTTLAEIDSLMAQLPATSTPEGTQYAGVRAKYLEQKELITRATEVKSLKELVDFTKINGKAAPDNISLVNNRIYAGDSWEKSVYVYYINGEKGTTTIQEFGQKINSLAMSIPDPDGKAVYFLNDKNTLVRIDAVKGTVDKIKINFRTDLGDIGGLFIYSNKLYAADKKLNDIFYYKKDGAKEPLDFTYVAGWLKEKDSLANSISINIDGSIYTLNADGTIAKFLKGKKEAFSLEKVDPILEKPSKMMVSPTQNYIYVLDPANKRLVVFDKTGKYLVQYVSQKFDNLKDFVIDEKSKAMYFLNGTIVLEAAAEHLK